MSQQNPQEELREPEEVEQVPTFRMLGEEVHPRFVEEPKSRRHRRLEPPQQQG